MLKHKALHPEPSKKEKDKRDAFSSLAPKCLQFVSHFIDFYWVRNSFYQLVEFLYPTEPVQPHPSRHQGSDTQIPHL